MLTEESAEAEAVMYSYSHVAKAYNRRQVHVNLHTKPREKKKIAGNAYKISTLGSLQNGLLDSAICPNAKSAYIKVLKHIILREDKLNELENDCKHCVGIYFKYAEIQVHFLTISRQILTSSSTADKPDVQSEERRRHLREQVIQKQHKLANTIKIYRKETYELIESIVKWRNVYGKGGREAIPCILYHNQNYILKMGTDVQNIFEKFSILRIWLGFLPNCLFIPSEQRYDPKELWIKNYKFKLEQWLEYKKYINQINMQQSEAGGVAMNAAHKKGFRIRSLVQGVAAARRHSIKNLILDALLEEKATKTFTSIELRDITRDAWDTATMAPETFWTTFTLRGEIVEAAIGFEDVFPEFLIGHIPNQYFDKQEEYQEVLYREKEMVENVKTMQRQADLVRQSVQEVSTASLERVTRDPTLLDTAKQQLRKRQEVLPPSVTTKPIPSPIKARPKSVPIEEAHAVGNTFITSVPPQPPQQSSVRFALPSVQTTTPASHAISKEAIASRIANLRHLVSANKEHTQVVVEKSKFMRIRPGRLAVQDDAAVVMQRLFRMRHASTTIQTMKNDKLRKLWGIITLQRLCRGYLVRLRLKYNTMGKQIQALRIRNAYKAKTRAAAVITRFVRHVASVVNASSTVRPKKFRSKRIDAVLDKVRSFSDELDMSLARLRQEHARTVTYLRRRVHNRSVKNSPTKHVARELSGSKLQDGQNEEYEAVISRRFKPMIAEEGVSGFSPLKHSTQYEKPIEIQNEGSKMNVHRIQYALPTDSLYRSRLSPLKQHLSTTSESISFFKEPSLSSTLDDASAVLEDIKSKIYISPVKELAMRSTLSSVVSPTDHDESSRAVSAKMMEGVTSSFRAHLRDLLFASDPAVRSGSHIS